MKISDLPQMPPIRGTATLAEIRVQGREGGENVAIKVTLDFGDKKVYTTNFLRREYLSPEFKAQVKSGSLEEKTVRNYYAQITLVSSLFKAAGLEDAEIGPENLDAFDQLQGLTAKFNLKPQWSDPTKYEIGSVTKLKTN